MKRKVIEHDDSIGIKFTYASNVNNSSLDKLTSDNSRHVMFIDGVRNFKKEVLGTFSTRTIKTYEELGSILCDVKVCENKEEIDKVIDSLKEKDLPYYKKSVFSFNSGPNYLRLEQISNGQDKKYAIKII